ncbi:septum site-determining protein MinD [Pseudoroseomonas wenyumeiae]|uniref:Septum site-determining protein MinD n=1 Tax=Teichococcus wenyumeiae TaxID=2478470 RepID=A0A3A9J7A5_9PROT|nr:septum site-determining protein MinD [Pseudoroseomonas wenyumeiae]RKK03107.1 septum site-determining protein MinD [Pseudoroseomonas wenyumeiae]RMI20105.1 septum site-determining protein MinD [Pseudoroseomonas wenyumeiae]
MSATIITVTSGKGGVGKTTTTAAFGAALALQGHRVCVVDFDMGLRNLDLVMGVEKRVVYDFLHVAHGTANLSQALVRDKRVPNLQLLATSQTTDKEALTPEAIDHVMNLLAPAFDYILCDSPAGIEHGAMMALHHADHAIVVCNPEVTSVRDADRIMGYIAARSRRAQSGLTPVREHLVVTRYNEERVKRGEMLSLPAIQDILAMPLLGVVPESPTVLRASNAGRPVSLETGTEVGRAYRAAAMRFLAEIRHSPAMAGRVAQPAGFLSTLAETAQRGLLRCLFRHA